jgi:hypothetical protein
MKQIHFLRYVVKSRDGNGSSKCRYSVCPPNSVPAPSSFARLSACPQPKIRACACARWISVGTGKLVTRNSRPPRPLWRAADCCCTWRRHRPRRRPVEARRLTEFEDAGHRLVVLVVMGVDAPRDLVAAACRKIAVGARSWLCRGGRRRGACAGADAPPARHPPVLLDWEIEMREKRGWRRRTDGRIGMAAGWIGVF